MAKGIARCRAENATETISEQGSGTYRSKATFGVRFMGGI